MNKKNTVVRITEQDLKDIAKNVVCEILGVDEFDATPDGGDMTSRFKDAYERLGASLDTMNDIETEWREIEPIVREMYLIIRSLQGDK